MTTLPVPGLFQSTGIAVSCNGTVYVPGYGDSTTTREAAVTFTVDTHRHILPDFSGRPSRATPP